MRFYPDNPDIETDIIWYFVDHTTPMLGRITPFGTRTWLMEDPIFPALGEVKERSYYRGFPVVLLDGTGLCGRVDQWENGLNIGDVGPGINPLTGQPICCGPGVLIQDFGLVADIVGRFDPAYTSADVVADMTAELEGPIDLVESAELVADMTAELEGPIDLVESAELVADMTGEVFKTVTGCSFFNPAPYQFRLTIAGVADGTCNQCSVFNGTWILTYVSSCFWASPVIVACGFNRVFRLSLSTNKDLLLSGAGSPTIWVRYLDSASGLDPFQPFVIPFLLESASCSNWPAMVTIEPVSL